MTLSPPILLMTRPEQASYRFVDHLPDDLRVLFELIVSPLIDIQYLEAQPDLTDIKAVIFTSGHGVAAVSADVSQDVAVYCVGEATARAARDAGWRVEVIAATADVLVERLMSRGAPEPVLHVHGRHTRGQVVQRLARNGWIARGMTAYEQVLCPLNVSATSALASDRSVIAPVFSPRTAQYLATQIPTGANPFFVALSAAVAEPLAATRGSVVEIAAAPDAGAMAVAVERAVKRMCRVESNPDAQ